MLCGIKVWCKRFIVIKCAICAWCNFSPQHTTDPHCDAHVALKLVIKLVSFALGLVKRCITARESLNNVVNIIINIITSCGIHLSIENYVLYYKTLLSQAMYV